MTAGQLPFDGDTDFQTIEAISKKTPASIKRLRKDAPTALIAIIEKSLKKTPAERYQSAAEIAGDLQRIVSELGKG